MATKPNMATKPKPHVSLAVICEKTLQEGDGVLSLIRIIDKVFIPALAPTEGVYGITLAVGLKSGDFKGKGKIKIDLVTPSGKVANAQELEVELQGREHGANVIVNVLMAFQEEGLHQFRIYFNDDLLTQTPLVVAVIPPSPMQTQSDTKNAPKEKR